MADIDIINPVNDATISGNIKASDVLSGLLISKIITKKNILVANVDDEYNSLSLYCRFSNENGGVFLEIQSHAICTNM
ncbi:hypothetical protein D5F51_08340 [Yersinia hibernica]|uniref:Uncharacterized protein n=2 Tax=Yersinia TaxID=629 RepID=A0ABX5QZ20_9GAMM|nr:hypothetical protein LC20_07830 [Yersinia hibernica]OVZ95063.1 hypothetical protein CBW54_00315 [Yersinia kristensenii]QAX78568.1 hypothetical protein D5F51_08340 [Yersinia hibernica]